MMNRTGENLISWAPTKLAPKYKCKTKSVANNRGNSDASSRHNCWLASNTRRKYGPS